MTTADAYLSAHGWSMKRGIGRLFTDSDLPLIRTKEAVVGKRPRGILSGFLVVVPGGGGVWFPPSHVSVPLRMRLKEEVRKGGFIASAYFYKGDYVVEDMLVWRDEPVFYYKTFPERWKHVQEFFYALAPDSVLQGGRILPASYTLPSAVSSENGIIEWIPFAPNQKRLLVIPQPAKATPPKAAVAKESVVARKDAAGPDVYQLWRGASHLGQALVRTLAVSKALRTSTAPDIPVAVELNKAFAKWEITAVLPYAKQNGPP